MRKLSILILTPAILILCFLVPYAYFKIKKINAYSPNVIGELATLMKKIDWHEYERTHPPRMRGRR